MILSARVIDADVTATFRAVSFVTPGGTSIRRAVLFDDGGVTDLGSLERTFSEAKDINDAGLIVGFVTNISGAPQSAFVWDDGVMTDLNTLIPADSGWSLLSAEGINDAGDIVGYGTFNGSTRAFLVTVPEPSAAALLVLPATALTRRRRSRR